MGSKRRQKQLTSSAAEPAEDARAEYDAFTVHLGLSLVSDMFDHHQACGFKDCRAAGRFLAFDKASGPCPVPLDTTRALIFAGMMLFDDAIAAELPVGGGDSKDNDAAMLALFAAAKSR